MTIAFAYNTTSPTIVGPLMDVCAQCTNVALEFLNQDFLRRPPTPTTRLVRRVLEMEQRSIDNECTWEHALYLWMCGKLLEDGILAIDGIIDWAILDNIQGVSGSFSKTIVKFAEKFCCDIGADVVTLVASPEPIFRHPHTINKRHGYLMLLGCSAHVSTVLEAATGNDDVFSKIHGKISHATLGSRLFKN